MKVTGDEKRHDGLDLSWLRTSCRDSQSEDRKWGQGSKGKVCKENKKECSTSIHDKQCTTTTYKYTFRTEMTHIMLGDGRRDIRNTQVSFDAWQTNKRGTYEWNTATTKHLLYEQSPATGIHLCIQIRLHTTTLILYSQTLNYQHKVWSTLELIQ